MIICLIGANWGERRQKDSKGRQFVDAQKDMGVEGWGSHQKQEIIQPNLFREEQQ